MAFDFGTYEVKAPHPSTVIIAGQITGETTGPTVGAIIGKKFSVAYTATGIYTVTFTDPMTAILSVTASFAATTPGDLKGHTLVLEAVANTGFKVNVYGDGAGGAPAAHALVDLEWINFIAIGLNSEAVAVT